MGEWIWGMDGEWGGGWRRSTRRFQGEPDSYVALGEWMEEEHVEGAERGTWAAIRACVRVCVPRARLGVKGVRKGY